MARQDETPTPGPRREGPAEGATEAPDPAAAAQAEEKASPAGPDGEAPDHDHDAWDAAFAAALPDSGAQAARTDGAAGAASPDETARRAAPGSDSVRDSVRDAEASEAPAAPEAGGVREAAVVPDTETASRAGTVPGGHPSLAQRSSLPMRRASTLPDISRLERAKGEDSAGTGSTPEPDPTPQPATADTRTAAQAPADGAAKASTAAVSAAAASAGAHAASPQGRDGRTDDDAADGLTAEEAAEARRRAAEREAAADPRPVLARVLQVMIAVFFPVMLLAAAIRAVATPLFLWVEYHRPGFPADAYGFSTEDRMTYGSYAVDYLLNWSGPRYLGDLVAADGQPLYLDTEVSHMADVKLVLTVAFLTALGMLLLSILAAVYLARRSPGGIRRALFSGALLTLVLIGALVVTAVLSWEQFFTQMHNVFFAQGNWTFRLDDTLIRLFPAQFWMDAGIAIAGIVLLVCVAVLAAAWPTRRRREKDRQAREAVRLRRRAALEDVH